MKRIVTVTAPAESYDLTDLETVKDELGIPAEDVSQDDRLARYITEASSIISDVCQRIFQVEGLTETIYSSRHERDGSLYLSRKPITNIFTIATTAPATEGDTTLQFDAVDGIVEGMPVSGSGIAAATVVDTIGEGLTLSLPITADIPSGTDITFGISVDGLTYGVDYQLDLATGNLFRSGFAWHCHWGASPLVVSYFSGFDPIPPTISGTCIRIVAMLNQRRALDPLVRSVSVEGLDAVTYRDWTASDMRDFIASELSAYMPPPAFA